MTLTPTGIVVTMRTTMPSPETCFRLMIPGKQRLLFDNTARSVGVASREVQQRPIRNCTKTDPARDAGVAEAFNARQVEENPERLSGPAI